MKRQFPFNSLRRSDDTSHHIVIFHSIILPVLRFISLLLHFFRPCHCRTAHILRTHTTHTLTPRRTRLRAIMQWNKMFSAFTDIQIYDAFSQSGRCCADRSFLNKIIIKSIYSVLLFGVVVRAWQWGRSTLINVEVMNWQWSLRLPTTTTTSTNSTDERRH